MASPAPTVPLPLMSPIIGYPANACNPLAPIVDIPRSMLDVMRTPSRPDNPFADRSAANAWSVAMSLVRSRLSFMPLLPTFEWSGLEAMRSSKSSVVTVGGLLHGTASAPETVLTSVDAAATITPTAISTITATSVIFVRFIMSYYPPLFYHPVPIRFPYKSVNPNLISFCYSSMYRPGGGTRCKKKP